MAGVDRGADGPEAGVSETVAAQVVDHGFEEVLSRHHEKCTIWYMPEQRRTNQTIHITGTSTAAPHRVFEVLIDTARWPDWAPMSAAEIQQPAAGDEPEGLGAIRRFTTGRTVSVERVVAFDRDRAFSYELISGLPLLDYRADVTLEPTAGGGTAITWHSEFRPKRPGTGWIYRLALKRFIGDLVSRLARTAERARVD